MTGWRVAVWAAVVHVVALARLWRTWWLVACTLAALGIERDVPLMRDAGALLLAVLVVVLAWRGPSWWREGDDA